MNNKVYQSDYETIEEFQVACEKAQRQASKRFIKSIEAEIEQAAKEIKEKMQGRQD